MMKRPMTSYWTLLAVLFLGFHTSTAFAKSHEAFLRMGVVSHDGEDDGPNTYMYCDNLSQPIEGEYCLYLPLTNQGDDLLYFMHGKGGTVLSWGAQQSPAHQIEKYWRENHYKRPAVVSVSFGPIWLLATQNESEVSGLYELFTRKIMPQIEASLAGYKGRRIVFGLSMGGVNTIQLAFKNPELFAKAAPVCAPMATISPFSTTEEIKAYAEQTIAHNYYKKKQPHLVFETMSKAAMLTQAFYPTPEDWKTGNPFDLAEQVAAEKLPELYVAAGMYDEYGLFESTEQWTTSLKAKGARVRWHPQLGNHCAVDLHSLAKFLAE